jgi:hypothetical protein
MSLPSWTETQVSVTPSYLASESLRVPKAGRSPLGKRPRRAARSRVTRIRHNLLGIAARSQSQKTLFLTRSGRIAPTQIDLRRPTSRTLGKIHYRDCYFMRHVAHFGTANEFRCETKTRTLPTIDAKPESENRQSVCRRSAKKQDPPHGQKTYRLAQT